MLKKIKEKYRQMVNNANEFVNWFGESFMLSSNDTPRTGISKGIVIIMGIICAILIVVMFISSLF